MSAGKDIEVEGNGTNNGGTFTPGNKTVTFKGAAAQTIGRTAAAQTFNDLTLSNTSGGVSVGGSTTELTLNRSLNITGGSFTAPSGALTLAGNWTNGGAFTHHGGSVVFGGTTTVAGSNVTPFNNIIINNGATVSAGKDIEVEGNWTNNGGTFTPGNKMVTFNGAAAQTIGGTAAAQTFNDLTLSNTSGGVSVTTTDLTLNGSLLITSGSSFTAPSGTLTLAGAWTNRGTFTHSAGSVIFSGTTGRPSVGAA